ncbi:amidohydrolase [candidate division KSB1 bacterium]|nr:amidohydrolase [candidate division KSB1 bacterium]
MVLIDSHLHFFSHDFFTALARQKDAANVEAVLAALATRTKVELPALSVKAHLDKWLHELDRHQITQAIVFASVPEETNAVGEALRLAEGRLTGFFLVNPKVEGSSTRVQNLSSKFGYRGVILFPALHHYHVHAEELVPFFEAMAASKLCVFVHFGILQVALRDALGLPRLYDSHFANPLDLQAVANRFPQLRFIIPHFGCGFWRETLMLGMQCENVFVDTSSSNNWMAAQEFPLTLADVFHRTKAVFGAERILFGTDSGVFPRGWRKDIFEAQLTAMKSAAFSEREIALVLGGNAQRLLAS